MGGLGNDFGDFVKCIIDVGAEIFGVEDDIQLLVRDGAAAVVAGCRSRESHGVRWTDGVELVCAGFTMGLNVALELIDGAICVAVYRSQQVMIETKTRGYDSRR